MQKHYRNPLPQQTQLPHSQRIVINQICSSCSLEPGYAKKKGTLLAEVSDTSWVPAGAAPQPCIKLHCLFNYNVLRIFLGLMFSDVKRPTDTSGQSNLQAWNGGQVPAGPAGITTAVHGREHPVAQLSHADDISNDSVARTASSTACWLVVAAGQ
jgi:hypothetical protein